MQNPKGTSSGLKTASALIDTTRASNDGGMGTAAAQTCTIAPRTVKGLYIISNSTSTVCSVTLYDSAETATGVVVGLGQAVTGGYVSVDCKGAEYLLGLYASQSGSGSYVVVF